MTEETGGDEETGTDGTFPHFLSSTLPLHYLANR